MDEKNILDMMKTGQSWEQILYEVVAWEGLDPWDLDIGALSTAFGKYISKLDQVDFKIPAKYVIIASILLRMKSDNMRLLDMLNPDEPADMIETNGTNYPQGYPQEGAINPLVMPPRRMPTRQIMIGDLVSSLRKALGAQKRRDFRLVNQKDKIVIEKREDITKRITGLYSKITSILTKFKKDEVKFSHVVPKWEKEIVADTFLPLLYLDHQKKVDCLQEEFFKEITIKKREGATLTTQDLKALEPQKKYAKKNKKARKKITKRRKK